MNDVTERWFKELPEQFKKYTPKYKVWNEVYNRSGVVTQTVINGITFTDNGDGSYTCNGTATADAEYNVIGYEAPEFSGFYYIGGCPSGGKIISGESYVVNYSLSFIDEYGIGVNDFGESGSGYIGSITDSWEITSGKLYIIIKNGVTVNNLVFYPKFVNLERCFPGTRTEGIPKKLGVNYEYDPTRPWTVLGAFNPPENQAIGLYNFNRLFPEEETEIGTNKTKIYSIINIFGRQLQQLESTIQDLNEKRQIATAEGMQLDGIGDIVSLTRKEAKRDSSQDTTDDAIYRLLLYFKLKRNNGYATAEEIINAFYEIFNPTELSYQETGNASVSITMNSDDNTFAQWAWLLQSPKLAIKPAGVGVNLAVITDSFFGFSDTNDKAKGMDDYGVVHNPPWIVGKMIMSLNVGG